MTWKDELNEEDGLTLPDIELEELDNDEINANEAGFLKGYEETD